MGIDFDKHKFLISLSFSGDQRKFIAILSNFLGAIIGQENIFYDFYYEGELSGPDLDLKLQKVYGKQSEIIAIFFSKSYNKSEWCFGVEWRVIRDIVKHLQPSQSEKLKFFRFDDTPIDGLLSIDGYIQIGRRTPYEIGTILLRLLHNERRFIIRKHDEVVVIFPSNIDEDSLNSVIEKIQSIVGVPYLVDKILRGSTILQLGMFENSHIRLLSWIQSKRKIHGYEVDEVIVNNKTVFNSLPSKRNNLVSNPSESQDQKNSFKVINITSNSSGQGLRRELRAISSAYAITIKTLLNLIYEYAINHKELFFQSLKNARPKPGDHIGASISRNTADSLSEWAKHRGTSRGLLCCFIIEKCIEDNLISEIIENRGNTFR